MHVCVYVCSVVANSRNSVQERPTYAYVCSKTKKAAVLNFTGSFMHKITCKISIFSPFNMPYILAN